MPQIRPIEVKLLYIFEFNWSSLQVTAMQKLRYLGRKGVQGVWHGKSIYCQHLARIGLPRGENAENISRMSRSSSNCFKFDFQNFWLQIQQKCSLSFGIRFFSIYHRPDLLTEIHKLFFLYGTTWSIEKWWQKMVLWLNICFSFSFYRCSLRSLTNIGRTFLSKFLACYSRKLDNLGNIVS